MNFEGISVTITKTYLEHEEVQWTILNVRTSVDRWTPRELNKHIARAEEVCKTETLSTNVHTQVHHFDRRRLDQTLTTNHTKGWRSVPDAILPGHRRAHWWVPARTPTVHQCHQSGEAVGGPDARRPKTRGLPSKQRR